jgi:hypothetical protein
MKIDYPQLEFLHPLLRELMEEAERMIYFMTGKEAVVTSLYRIDDNGVHGTLPLRACDLRCRDAAIGENIAAELNGRWTYDPMRPEMASVIFHDVGRGAHLHLQVHPRSVIAP